MKKGSQLSADYLDSIYDTIDSVGENLENNIAQIYNVSSSLYNHSSAIEDILTANLSTFTNRLNSVSFSYANDTVSFIESFESSEFIDKKFSVDRALTIDSINKTLTLPEKNTIKNKMVSIIIEPDSNGAAGNSLNGFKNSDIAVINDDDVSSMFEYEKFTGTFSSTNLDLILTLKLESYSVTNGMYIKLYSPDGIQFPIVDFIEVSPDGEKWISVDYFLDTTTPKNDYFIRYLSEPTRYVRLKISQFVAQYVNTGFGVKQRYAIGIREIQVLTTEYAAEGEYVSIPFSTGSPISTVSLEADYESNSDLTFSISANNGGKWLPIKSGDVLDLYSSDTGVLYIENLKSVRMKINMKRSISPTLSNYSQLTSFSPNNTYYLKYKPMNLTASIGAHVSFGDIKSYLPQVQFPYNIKNELSDNSGISIFSLGASAYGKFDSQETLLFESSGIDLLESQTASGEVIRGIRKHILANKGNMFLVTLRYIPYNDNIESMLEVYVGGQKLNQWYMISDTQIQPTYFLLPHENKYHTYLYLDLKNLGIFNNIDGDVLVNGTITNGINIKYAPYIYAKEVSIYNGPDIALPYKSIYPTAENFKVISISDDGTEIMLNNKTDFALLSDRQTIRIDNSVYSNRVSYSISYCPAFNIDEFLPSEINNIAVDISAISDADQTSNILFDYIYQDQQSLADVKYYSPICKKYKVTLS